MRFLLVIRETIRSLGAFLLVGGAATLVHYIVLKTLMTTGLVDALATANILAFLCGLMISYSGNFFFVFEKRRSHLAAIGFLLLGYLIALSVNTSILVGLAEGRLFTFLEGPLNNTGGHFVLLQWERLIKVLPFLGDARQMHTTPAFIIATGISASMTYLWNRFVVFQPRVRLS